MRALLAVEAGSRRGLICHLHRRQRKNDRFVGLTVNVHFIVIRLHHANHLIINAICLNHQAERVFIGANYVFIHFLTYHTHLSRLRNIRFVDKSSVKHLASVNIVIIWQNSFHTEITAFCSVKHIVFAVVCPLAGDWGDDIHTVNFFLNRFNISHIRLP